MQKIKTIASIPCQGKKVFVRTDFNTPLDERGNISDDSRIAAAIPTIKYLMKNNAKVILASHLGRPKGKRVQRFSLQNAALAVARLIGQPVLFSPDCVGDEVERVVNKMADGTVILLENLRFHKEETDNDEAFAMKLSNLADIYVNDAFGSVHRAHASTEGITKFVKKCVAGFLVEKELEFLGTKVSNPERPFVVILGGAKVSDKIKVINSLLDKADVMLIGGAMAYTFLAAKGHLTGSSLVEEDKIATAQKAIKKAEQKGIKLLLPEDHIVASNIDFEGRTGSEAGPSDIDIDDGKVGIDIGPKTIQSFKKEILAAKTILWNGPMGVFEISEAAAGTFELAKIIATSGAVSIIGGGDSAKAIKESGYANKVTFISTGGGASLEFLEGSPLPGIEALTK